MILFIGDEPSECTDKEIAFKGAKCEERLMQWVDYVRDDRWFIIINRIDPDFSRYVAMALANHDPIIALGNKASDALYDVPHYKLPHPSGRNRMNNDIGFIRLKLDECRTFVQNPLSLQNKVR